MKRYIYVEEDDLADRGFNRAVSVYQLQRGDFPRYVGSNFRIDVQSWYGYKLEAMKIISEKDGHKIKNQYSFINKNVELQGL